ncbi:MAG: hypothetical protein ABR936_01360 [Bacteroidota bacterium]|jgi:hypothetical protein
MKSEKSKNTKNNKIINLKLLFNLIFLILLASLFLIGCGSKKLDRGKAEELLLANFNQGFKDDCRLNYMLRNKPEFEAIKANDFFEKSIEITGIQKVSDVEAVVECIVVTKGKINELQKWKRSMTSLKNRLIQLRPSERRVSGFPSNFYWIFKDPADGQEYIHDITEGLNFGDVWGSRPANITKSDQFKFYAQLEGIVDTYISNETVKSGIIKTHMRLYDDGWRIGE